jgi:hypothetical protein
VECKGEALADGSSVPAGSFGPTRPHPLAGCTAGPSGTSVALLVNLRVTMQLQQVCLGEARP